MQSINSLSNNKFETKRNGKDFFATYLLDFSMFNPDDELIFQIDLQSILQNNLNPIQTMILSWNGLCGTVFIQCDNNFNQFINPWESRIFSSFPAPLFPLSGNNVFPFFCTPSSKILFTLNRTVTEDVPISTPFNQGQLQVILTSCKLKSYGYLSNQYPPIYNVFPTINPFAPIIPTNILVNSVSVGTGVKVNNTIVGQNISINGVPIV